MGSTPTFGTNQNHTEVKLYADEIGQRRLQELGLRVGHGISMSFNARELGEYSIRKQPVLVVLVGLTANQQWVLMPCTKQNIEQHRGHCYLVKGRKVTAIEYRHKTGTIEQMLSAFEGADLSEPLYRASSNSIFHAGKGQQTRKKPQISGSRRESANGKPGTVGWYVTTKRFKGSRLTCVCKCRAI